MHGVDPASIRVVRPDGASSFNQLELIPSNPHADVAVFSLYQKQLTPNILLETTTSGVQYGQDVYFLGFPLGWSVQNDSERLPFVKKAIMSGVTQTTDGVSVWIFDGMNLEGFSGGPIVFKNNTTRNWHVMGIVHGYHAKPLLVHDAGGNAVGQAMTNSGFVVGFDIAHATEAIDQFVARAGG